MLTCGGAVPYLQVEGHPVPVGQVYLEGALQLPRRLELERAVPRHESDVVAIVHQVVGEGKHRITVRVHDGRRMREGEVDVAVALGKFLEFTAEVGLAVAAEMRVLADVQAGEVDVASRAGDVQSCQLYDEAVAGAVTGKPHLALAAARLGEVPRTYNCFLFF